MKMEKNLKDNEDDDDKINDKFDMDVNNQNDDDSYNSWRKIQ